MPECVAAFPHALACHAELCEFLSRALARAVAQGLISPERAALVNALAGKHDARVARFACEEVLGRLEEHQQMESLTC